MDYSDREILERIEQKLDKIQSYIPAIWIAVAITWFCVFLVIIAILKQV